MITMKSLISVNNKFMEIPAAELMSMVSEYADGVEVYVDYSNNNELNYLDELARIASEKQLWLQVHGQIECDTEEQEQFLDRISRYGFNHIPVTFHPIYREDAEESITMTIGYLKEIVRYVKQKCPNLEILIENLNDWEGRHRLKMREVKRVIDAVPELGVTYDIGHVIADGAMSVEDIISPVDGCAQKNRNLHVHSCKTAIIDHQPIYQGDKKWNIATQALAHFSSVPTVVFEYDVYACRGNSLREQVLDYLQTFAPIMDEVKRVS